MSTSEKDQNVTNHQSGQARPAGNPAGGLRWQTVVIIVIAIVLIGLPFLPTLKQMFNSGGSTGTTNFDLSNNITKDEIENWLRTMPPDQVRALVSRPDAKTQLISRIKEIFSLSIEATKEGLHNQPDVQAELGLMKNLALASFYREHNVLSNPTALKVSEQDKTDYLKNNPKAFDEFVQANSRLKTTPPEQLDKIKPQFAEMMVLVDRAKKDKLEQDSIYLQSFKFQYASYLAVRLQQDMQKKIQVADDELRAYYDTNKDQFEESHFRHILIALPKDPASKPAEGAPAPKNKPATKEEARKIAETVLGRVKAGEDFQKLAKEFSDDIASGTEGGDLGYQRRSVGFVPEFKDVAFKLKSGEISDVVETRFGYHIIKVEDSRVVEFNDETKADIKNEVLVKKIQERVGQLTKTNAVTVADNFNLPKPPPVQERVQFPNQPAQPAQPVQPAKK